MKNDSSKEQKEKGYTITKSLILWAIDKYVRQPPYIMTVSKKQLWWGNGMFKDSPYPEGLLRTLDLKNPTEKEKAKKRAFYGYDVMRSPYVLLNGIINSTMRNAIINETIDKLSDIRVILGRGYIREDGTLDPAQKRGISCYVIFATDESLRPIQSKWIQREPEWKRLQIERNIQTHGNLLMSQIKSALNKIAINEALMEQQEYLQLETGIKRSEITWEADD